MRPIKEMIYVMLWATDTFDQSTNPLGTLRVQVIRKTVPQIMIVISIRSNFLDSIDKSDNRSNNIDNRGGNKTSNKTDKDLPTVVRFLYDKKGKIFGHIDSNN